MTTIKKSAGRSACATKTNCRSLAALGMTTTKKGTGKGACATEAAWKAALEKLPRVPHERNRTLETALRDSGQAGCGTRAERRPRDDSDSGGIPRSGSTLLTGES